jgi:hypothetical protein
MARKRKTDKTYMKLDIGKPKLPAKCYTRADAEALLPAVGTKMRRIPSMLQSEGSNKKGSPQRCTVKAVSRPGLWFRVFYEDLGFSECIKVPDVQLQAGGRDQ